MSSGRPCRWSGSAATRFALAVPDSVPASASRRANVLSISSVSTVPGATQLTRMRGRVLERELPREPDQRPLRGDVGAHPRLPWRPGDRGDVDDRPAAARDHAGQERLGDEVDRVEVDVDGAVPLLVVVVGEQVAARPARDAGVVDEHVDGAERVGDLTGEPRQRSPRSVRSPSTQQDPAAEGGDLLQRPRIRPPTRARGRRRRRPRARAPARSPARCPCCVRRR